MQPDKMLPTTCAANPMLPNKKKISYFIIFLIKEIRLQKHVPSHDACSGVKRIASFGFISAFWPVSADNNISGYVNVRPILNCIKFFIVIAIDYELKIYIKNNNKCHKNTDFSGNRQNFTCAAYALDCRDVKIFMMNTFVSLFTPIPTKARNTRQINIQINARAHPGLCCHFTYLCIVGAQH